MMPLGWRIATPNLTPRSSPWTLIWPAYMPADPADFSNKCWPEGKLELSVKILISKWQVDKLRNLLTKDYRPFALMRLISSLS
jgi:hypothetical protein